MIDPTFVFAAVALNMIGTGYYARAAVCGEVRPHPLTWALWAAAPLAAFAAQLADGVGLPTLTTAVASVNPAIILIVLLRSGRDLRWQVSVSDMACGALSVLALVAWIGLRASPIAVLLAILSDSLASVPTYRKAWTDPETEHPFVYFCLTLSSVITLLSIQSYRFTSVAFALYLGLLGCSLALVILGRRRVRLRYSSPEVMYIWRTQQN